MTLVVSKAAAKALSDPKAIPARVAAALMDDLKRIAADPYGTHPQAKALTGHPRQFRVRHGKWRAVYELDPTTDTMTVLTVGMRKDVYE